MMETKEELRNAERKYHEEFDDIIRSKKNNFIKNYHKNLPKAMPARTIRIKKMVLPKVEKSQRVCRLIKTTLPKVQKRPPTDIDFKKIYEGL